MDIFSASLEFDGSETLFEIEWRGKSLEFDRTRFVSWVNQVLRSHQDPSVDELKVCFDMDKQSYKCNIDNWIVFAIQKISGNLNWTFEQILEMLGAISTLFQCICLHEISNLGFLTSLRLVNVNVTGEFLEYLLSHNPFPEVISTKLSPVLVRAIPEVLRDTPLLQFGKS